MNIACGSARLLPIGRGARDRCFGIQLLHHLVVLLAQVFLMEMLVRRRRRSLLLRLMLPICVAAIFISRTAIEHEFVGHRLVDGGGGIAVDHLHHFAGLVDRLGQAQMHDSRRFDQAVAFVVIEILIRHIVVVMWMVLCVMIDFGRCAGCFRAINADALVRIRGGRRAAAILFRYAGVLEKITGRTYVARLQVPNRFAAIDGCWGIG